MPGAPIVAKGFKSIWPYFEEYWARDAAAANGGKDTFQNR
jgi:hypothetical protein